MKDTSKSLGKQPRPSSDCPLVGEISLLYITCCQVGFNMEPTEETPLIEVLKLGLEKYLDSLQQISSQASKEFALENVSNQKFFLI